jgi:hypothetical protein
MKALRVIGVILMLGPLISTGAVGQPRFRDQGDWPCRQIKVGSVSVATIWTGPSIEQALKTWRDDTVVSDLVARIAVRRTPIEAAQKAIHEFAAAAGEKRKERLTLLFAGVYDRLDTERSEVIAGLDRYGRKQKELADRLRTETQEMRTEQDRARSDPQKVKEMSEALQWDMRIFEERRRAVGFACETPALIEQRLGALARAILSAM